MNELEPHIDSNDGQKYSEDFLSFVQSCDSDYLSEMLEQRVIPSFRHSMSLHNIRNFSEDAIRIWTVDMLLDGLKPGTVRRYTGALHTLYRQWMETHAGDVQDLAFTIPLSEIASEDNALRLNAVDNNLKKVEVIGRIKVNPGSDAYLYNRAFQYLLFNPDASLQDVVRLKFTDDMPDSAHIEDVVLSMRKAPQAKYVFPLQQGKRRDGAIIKDLLSELHTMARRIGLSFGSSFSRDSITAIWIAAAIKEGIPYSEITGVIRKLPQEYAFLSLISPAMISEERKTEILNDVADYITDKTPGWFVLRLRSGVEPEDIKDRLEDLESPLRKMIQYYYPQRTLKKMENKKMVSYKKPFIPGILFFRLPYDRIAPLVAAVGDLAWCYRTSNNVSSPYSVIPKEEMRIFQRCVGEFTDDIEMDIVTALPPLAEGDEVVIEDGSLLDGQHAIVRKIRSVDGSLTYILKLSDTEFLRWQEVSLPASHLSKVEAK